MRLFLTLIVILSFLLPGVAAAMEHQKSFHTACSQHHQDKEKDADKKSNEDKKENSTMNDCCGKNALCAQLCLSKVFLNDSSLLMPLMDKPSFIFFSETSEHVVQYSLDRPPKFIS